MCRSSLAPKRRDRALRVAVERGQSAWRQLLVDAEHAQLPGELPQEVRAVVAHEGEGLSLGAREDRVEDAGGPPRVHVPAIVHAQLE